MNVIPTPQRDKNGGADYKLQVKQRSEEEADRKEKKKGCRQGIGRVFLKTSTMPPEA